MARIAIGLNQKKNQQAAQEANEEFYKHHPDMKGRRIDPCNPDHLKYQKEWMDAYIKNGGAYRVGRYTAQCGEVAQACPCDGRLTVSVVDGTQRTNGVPGVDVAVYGPSDGRQISDSNGEAAFCSLAAGVYFVEVTLQNGRSYASAVQIACNQLTCKTIVVDLSLPPIDGEKRITGRGADSVVVQEPKTLFKSLAAYAAEVDERAKKLAAKDATAQIDKLKSELKSQYPQYNFEFVELSRTLSKVDGGNWETEDVTPDVDTPIPVIINTYGVTYEIVVQVKFKGTQK